MLHLSPLAKTWPSNNDQHPLCNACCPSAATAGAASAAAAAANTKPLAPAI
jgi:hypothetical protein